MLALTGFLGLFGDMGLGRAAIQHEVAHEQSSTIFWINVGVGAALTLLTAALAPALVAFYHEPRLPWMTVACAAAFLLGGLGVQHSAPLSKSMRFVAQAKIDLPALVVRMSVDVVMAGTGVWLLDLGWMALKFSRSVRCHWSCA